MEIALYQGDMQARARSWVELSDEDRRRRATVAANMLEETELWGLTEAYLATFGEAGAKVSRHTVDAYRRGQTVLLMFARERAMNLLRPSSSVGAVFVRTLEAEGYSPSTLRVRLAAARLLYKALRWSGATLADPFVDAKPAKDKIAPWEKRAPYQGSEVDALLAHADDPHDRLLILLGAHAGLRVSEALSLKGDDVSLGSKRLVVRKGKGGKKRTVPMSNTLQEAFRVLSPFDGSVFPFVSSVTARRRLYRLCLTAGVDYKAMHALRHTCGTRIVKESQDLERAARMLGHSSIEVTRTYAKWSDDSLSDQVGDW